MFIPKYQDLWMICIQVCMEMADAVAALVAQKPTYETLAGMALFLSRNLGDDAPDDISRAAATQSCIQGVSTIFQHMNTNEIAQVPHQTTRSQIFDSGGYILLEWINSGWVTSFDA